MQMLVVRGGRPLAGTVEISGSKNAVLPMLASSILFRRGCVIRKAPELTDVEAAVEILRYLGADVRRTGDTLEIRPRNVRNLPIPQRLMDRMRGSVFFAGAMMARFGSCRLGRPGGCPLGERPVNFHGAGLRAFGARETEPGLFAGLSGGTAQLPYPSVGATENLLMAALGAQKPCRIENAAREPEIVCLCDFLRAGGCRISGDGTKTIEILPGLPDRAEGEPIPDRMEAATFLCAAASAGGTVRLTNVIPGHLGAVLDALGSSGCRIEAGKREIVLCAGALHAPEDLVTGPYPEFPTDAQAPMLAAMLRAAGSFTMKETVFSDRMKHISGLRALGGQIECRSNTARITGVPRLCGAAVRAEDLRGAAALAVAALAAEGETRIDGLRHLLRGYERFDGKLRGLGADAVLS